MKEQQDLNPTLKTNIQDSLQFLLEINREIERLNSNLINPGEFTQFMQKRSKEWNYISDYKHTFKILEQLKNM